MAGVREVTAEEVVSKLKDDGDFDKLRLKIIRKLKDNEELRNSITEVVKQSAALNRPSAETMKPRELSDIIHDEVKEKVMSQISDGLWEIIRSADGMKSEITEAVQSVYDKLNPPPKTDDQAASSSHVLPVQDITHNIVPTQLSDEQLKDSTIINGHSHTHDEQPGKDADHPGNGDIHHMEVDESSHAPLKSDKNGDPSPAKELSDGSDDDVPPGFG